MLTLTSNEIRRRFLDYFAARGHRVVKSSSLVPVNDPTLLFTNAGMNQFKDVFLGLEHREYLRATSSQKCVRAGGKHNDLENVGRTRRHHTFFEMLGNFSFGDYFKKDAIEYAWDLMTREFRLPVDKLYVTVFGGGEISPGQYVEADEVARGYWKAIGVSPDRIFEGSVKDNFWAMGDTGPCGPCSEIHMDLGPLSSDWGHTDCVFPCDCGRYVELWNLVFMQFNRDASGTLAPLPRPSIDTGMGLERIAAVLQGKNSNFETDLLFPLVEAAAEMSDMVYGEKPENDVSLRILADHSRSATFLISDGVIPANESRGYVLRLIIRRALYHGQKLGLQLPFFYKLSGRVIEVMKDAYPELLETAVHVAGAIKTEEERYAHTTGVALNRLENSFVEIRTGKDVGVEVKFSDWRSLYSSHHGHIESILEILNKRGLPTRFGAQAPPNFAGWVPGEELFSLHDTFGLRPDFVVDVVSNYALTVHHAAYDAMMMRQRELARASWKGLPKYFADVAYQEEAQKYPTRFLGYTQTRVENSRVLQITEVSDPSKTNPDVHVVLDQTPFYAEAGGQVGDKGWLRIGDQVVATVEDTFAPVSGLTVHVVKLASGVTIADLGGKAVTAEVDSIRRDAIRRNHTATHLLHAALRQVLGTHVKQAGSVVKRGRLRFDFSHFTSLDENEIEEIETLANAEILKNEPVETDIMDLDKAVQTGAMAIFGEKYGDRVRVVSVPGFSKELCGGTHVSRTGDIGIVKITSEGGISAGVRRIEAVTGLGALKQFQAVTSLVHHTAEELKTSPADLPEAVEKLAESERILSKQLEALKLKVAQAELTDVDSRVRAVGDVRVLAVRVDALDRGQMRTLADVLRSRLKSGVVVLGSVSDGKVALIAALTQDLTKRLHAGKIAQAVAQKLGGTGGGRADLAEAGGKNATMLDTVLNEVYDIVGSMV